MYTKLTYYVMILIPIWCLMSLRWNSTGSYCPWMTLGYNPILWNSLRGKRTFLGFFIMPRLNFFLQSNSIENNRRTKFTTSGEMQWKEYVTLNTETPALGFLQAGVRFMDETADPALATGSSLLPNMASIFIQEISLENHSFLCLKSKSSCMC